MFRLDPQLPAAAYKTYALSAPPDRQVRAACEQVGCEAWRRGWTMTIDEATVLGAAQALYIRTGSGRTFTEAKTGLGLTVFRFESGQRCFVEHHTRPEIYTVHHGDWRRSALLRQHARPADWVDDFGEHQQRLADVLERG